MTVERDGLRDWHRLFGILLTDFFTDSPFEVDIERDLSQQQQFLDVVIVRRLPGEMDIQMPDGLDGLAPHNLITFKSHHESLDSWAMKELIGHYVAYRKLVSAMPTDLLPEQKFRLFAVCARYPQNLFSQVPWQERQPGVYDCRWGTDDVRIVVARQLPRAPHNAPLHLFSASQELVTFGSKVYRRRSENTSQMLGQLFTSLKGEGFAMSYTMEDFKRDVFRRCFQEITPEELRKIVKEMRPEERREIIKEMRPEERREIVKEMRPEERREIVKEMRPEERREIVKEMRPEERREIIKEMRPEDRREIIKEMRPEERREIIKEMRPEDRREIIKEMPPEERREVVEAVLQSLPLEERLAGLSRKDIRAYLEANPAKPPKPRRKKK